MDSKGRLDLRANKVYTLHFCQLLDLSRVFQNSLERHVSGGTSRANISLPILSCKNTILDRSPNEAVRLSVPELLDEKDDFKPHRQNETHMVSGRNVAATKNTVLPARFVFKCSAFFAHSKTCIFTAVYS